MGEGLIPEEHRRLVAAALAALDVRNLVLGIHDPSFPSEPSEDTGRGSPYTQGATRFLEFIRELGFTGIQLGPQGQTSESNASPYDSTLFSRNVLNVPLASLASEEGGSLLSPERLASLVDHRPLGTGPGERYRYAFRAQRAALDEAWSRFQRERTQRDARPVHPRAGPALRGLHEGARRLAAARCALRGPLCRARAARLAEVVRAGRLSARCAAVRSAPRRGRGVRGAPQGGARPAL